MSLERPPVTISGRWDRRFCLALSTLLTLSGCGYVGEVQYPALNIPTPIHDLAGVERGANIYVHFTVPALTTEGLPVKEIGAIELRAGPNQTQPFKVDQWAASARRIDVPTPASPGLVQTTIPAAGFLGQSVVLGVRVMNARGRGSDWSNLVTMVVRPPLATPSDFKYNLTEKGVDLQWTSTGGQNFRVFRQAEKESRPIQMATITAPSFRDSQITYGMAYEYWVQSVNEDAESEPAGPLTITPKDTFAPEVPSGLSISQGLRTIELSWNRNVEPDFKAYILYRAMSDGPLEKIADMIEAANYSDSKVESGKTYRYAVSAIDQTGNESGKSPILEAVAP